jgi:hypothetical protein
MSIRVALLGVAVLGAPLRAQGNFLSAMEYSIAAPIGESQHFGPGSWSGANWEGRWMYRGRTSFGALLGFNEFYRRDAGTTSFPAGAVTGDQYRHLLVIPMLATAAWYTGKYDDPRWYVGGGIGPQYTEQIFQLGFDMRRKASWGLAVVPEVGLAFQAWYGTGGIVALRYHLPTQSSPFLGSTRRRFPYVSLSMGVGYR